MEISSWTAVDWLILAVPLAIGIFSVRIGAAQVREFHRRTGDTGVIMSVTGLSRFHDDAPKAEGTPIAAEQAKVPHPAC